MVGGKIVGRLSGMNPKTTCTCHYLHAGGHMPYRETMLTQNSAPFHCVAILIGEVARPSPVVVLVVPDHGNGLLHKWRPGHGAIKHNVPLLVHCPTTSPSYEHWKQFSLFQTGRLSSMHAPLPSFLTATLWQHHTLSNKSIVVGLKSGQTQMPGRLPDPTHCYSSSTL